MKKNICILLILISYVSCSNGQSKEKSDDKIDYAKEILGCWKLLDINYEIKSNIPFVDSLILEERQILIADINSSSFIIKFFENTMNEYDSNGLPNDNPAYYKIDGDSIFTQGIFRQDKSSGMIKIKGDTIYIKENASNELKRVFYNLKQRYKIIIPKDIKLEKMIRNVTCVRVPDCDQYKE